MDRNLALEVVRITEAAALASARWMGKGNEEEAEMAAAYAMKKAFNSISFCGTIIIGEGEKEEAPMLYIGEKVGSADFPKIDIALSPLEGTTICATGGGNAMSVVVFAEDGGFLQVPNIYMEKIAVGPAAKEVVDLKKSPTENLKAVAKAKNVYIQDLTVVILNRPRHESLIKEVREAGARIRLISDGDVAAAIATCFEETGIDILMGVGGASEGIVAAAALRCLGGFMQGRLIPRNQDDIKKVQKQGILDINRIYLIEDMASGNVMFAATGVTNGDFLNGVRFFSGGAETHSVVMRSKTRTIRFIKARHFFDFKPLY